MSAEPGRRKSKSGLLRRPAFGHLSLSRDDDSERHSARLLHKKRPVVAPLTTSKPASSHASEVTDRDSLPESPTSTRPGLLKRGRPSSIFGSLRSLKFGDDETPPGTSTSSKASSFNWKDFGMPSDPSDIGKNRTVLHHGEAQTNSGHFWKKREYLVLTETHLFRFKNQVKAAEVFHSIPSNPRQGITRHASNPSSTARAESEHSGEMISGIPLEQVVAVYLTEETRALPSVELAYFDYDAGQGSTLSLQFADRDEVDLWLRSLRELADRARVLDTDPIPPILSEYAARAVEREHDYDVTNYRIFKVVRRGTAKTISRSSSEDVSKVSATVCFLVIGMRAVHLIPLPKNSFRASSLSDPGEGGCFGIMCLTGGVSNQSKDDRFSLTFRSPFQKTHTFHLASLAATEILIRIRQTERYLRPNWFERPYAIELPAPVDDELYAADVPADDLDPFDRTMIAYCIAYGVNPSAIRYGVFDDGDEDSPRFELFEPAGSTRGYSALELLAVLRSLRYQNYKTITFTGIGLDVLNQSYDYYGIEHIPNYTRHGRLMNLTADEQKKSSLLVQEVRALATSTRDLRRFDFSFCIVNSATRLTYDGREVDGNCGIIEALFPLCKVGATNVDWIALNGIELQESDLDYLVSIAVEKTAHFRAIEASRTGLTDRGMALLLDVFRAHENTLEALDISGNPLRLVPSILSQQLSAFGFIRILDMSNVAVSSSAEPLLSAETLCQWRLEELRLRGIPLNEESVKALCRYLADPQSVHLRELILSNCSLTGSHVADMMESMSQGMSEPRWLHLDVSENRLRSRFERLAAAVSKNLAPSHLSMRSTDYDDEEDFEDLLLALATNTSIRFLNIAQTYLPSEAGEEVCTALKKMLAENQTLEQLDISGEESRLEVSKLGVGINEALGGLKQNRALEILRVQNQKLGVQGASTLAEVLKENSHLRQLHCEYNSITLTGFTDLVNALAGNKTLLYMSSLEEGRNEALRRTEEQIKLARNKEAVITSSTSSSSRLSSMRRTFANLSASVGSGPGGARTAGKLSSVPEWTQQDIQAALRLVAEGWEGQKTRLNAYLERNWQIHRGLPVEDEPDKTEQRPGTAGSLSKILQKVAIDSTPTMEKQVQLGDAAMEQAENNATDGDVPPDLLGALTFNDTPLIRLSSPGSPARSDGEDFFSAHEKSSNESRRLGQ